jgi:hypothetical protein
MAVLVGVEVLPTTKVPVVVDIPVALVMLKMVTVEQEVLTIPVRTKAIRQRSRQEWDK